MKKRAILLILATVFFSCKQGSKSASNTDMKEAANNTQEKVLSHLEKNIYTKYEYTYSKGKSIVVQNSLSKGGIQYADFKGNQYTYAVFWTRIINETDKLIEFKIKLPIDSYEIPALPGKYYKTLIPSDTMTIEKIPLFNYGLNDLKPFFDKNIDKPSSLKRTIKPKESTGFFVVTLRLIGGSDKYGVIRTELTLKGENLFYKIRDEEIQCGSIKIK